MPNTIHKVLLLLLTLLVFTVNSQERISRLELVMPIEDSIAIYIEKNLNDFNLPEEDLEYLNTEEGHESISKKSLNKKILAIKKHRLRLQYFKEYPESLKYYRASNYNKQSVINCNNGNLEQGFNNYSFYSRIDWNHPGGSNVDLDANLTGFTPFVPSNSLNNNGNASLVTIGLDTTLLSAGASLNRVFNGGRAIRLNPRNDDQEDATIITRQFLIDEPTLSINFAVAFNNPNHDDHDNPFVRFEVFDLSTNTIVDHRVITSTNSGACLINAPNSPGTSQWRYTPWSCLNLDVGESIGNNVELRILISDCSLTVHDAILYLDDICNNGNVCNNNLFGDISLNPLNLDCPFGDFQVCGTYINPDCAPGIPNMALNATGPLGFEILLNSTPFIDNTNGTFCFTINESDFGFDPSGAYELKVTATFGDGVQQVIIEDSSANIGPDITFNDCINPCELSELNPEIEGDFIVWNDISTTYTIEFISDGRCWRPSFEEDQEGQIVSQTYILGSPTNSINLLDVVQDMDREGLRWRIKTECSDWTDWCCITKGQNDQNPGDNFINIYGDVCYPETPCDDFEPSINLTSPNFDVVSGTVDYDIYMIIIAKNKIESGANSTYRAGDYIFLKPGFHAKSNSIFRAHIEDCSFVIETNRNVVKEIKKKVDIKIFPNPAKDYIDLISEDLKIKSIEVYNLYGMNVSKTHQLNKLKHTLNLRDAVQGHYFIKILLEDNSFITKTIILK